jgi:zeta-carotene isomerase
MWETGIMRVTRHPQMVGQGLWCAAHCLWTGSSVVLAASAALMAHHLFGCWHGDRRLKVRLLCT